MSLPTTDAIFAQSRAADSWVEYPFMERGDSTAKIYHMKCSVNRANYAPLAKNAPMTSAATSGVISLPFTGNSSAFFVGDFNHSYKDGGLVEFDRQFATIPATRTQELVGSRSFGFPTYQDVIYTAPATADAADYDENLWEYVAAGGGNTSPAPLYLTSTYYKSADIPASLPEVFRPTQNGLFVDYVTDGLSLIKNGAKAINGETFNMNITISATDPSATEYSTSISAGDYKTVDSGVERYAGDIFVVKKYEMVAQ
jgi:hypothetical protein